MNFGGFQKNSLIDFPGTIACVVFTRGCNFTCPYCHNPDLVKPPQKRTAAPKNGGGGTGFVFDEDSILKFLITRKGLLDGVVITGGEPTLQKDLAGFCQKVKALGYRVKLDTNGSNPQVLKQLFAQELVDYVAMDIKTDLSGYDRVWPRKKNTPDTFDTGSGNTHTDAIVESVRLIMEKASAYEFRTTCVKPFADKGRIQRIGELIRGADRYILQKCSKNVTVLDPEFLNTGDPFFSDTQIKQFKEIADNYVAACTIR